MRYILSLSSTGGIQGSDNSRKYPISGSHSGKMSRKGHIPQKPEKIISSTVCKPCRLDISWALLPTEPLSHMMGARQIQEALCYHKGI